MSKNAKRVTGWASVKGGKWHRTAVTQPSFMRDETALCGITFRPLNVTWDDEEPPTTQRHRCVRCLTESATAREE